MGNTFWSDFSNLLIGSIVGSIAILPYSLRLLKTSAKNKPLKLPLHVLLLLSILQNAVFFAVMIGLGLLAAHQIDVYSPLLQPSNEINHLLTSFILGVISGGIMLVVDLFFLPYFPKNLLDTALKTTQWENFTASFYGGINEEIFARLFGISTVIWLLLRIWHTNNGLPTTDIFWTTNIIMAVVFAVGHLPALKSVAGTITAMILVRTLLLNIPVGLLCGWLFWNYGIIPAMIGHFAADIIYHIGGTFVLRSKFAKK